MADTAHQNEGNKRFTFDLLGVKIPGLFGIANSWIQSRKESVQDWFPPQWDLSLGRATLHFVRFRRLGNLSLDTGNTRKSGTSGDPRLDGCRDRCSPFRRKELLCCCTSGYPKQE